MAYTGLESVLDKSGGSVFKLVVLASKRALEISEGQPKLVAAGSEIKPSNVALEEIAEGKVFYKKQ
jgi:DNA-directed RNA polymerase omega subunit